MKKAIEYGKTMTGEFLNENEIGLLRVVVSKICDNHPDDDFWKIADSIKAIVSDQFSHIMQDQSFREMQEAYEEKECKEYVKSDLKKNDFCSYEHDLT